MYKEKTIDKVFSLKKGKNVKIRTISCPVAK